MFSRATVQEQELARIAKKYDMNSNLSQQLKNLREYEIVIVCDDSGSMDTPLDGTSKTRWQYLMDLVMKVLEIAVIFDSNGVDIYFLNRGEVEGVKDPNQVRQLFAEEPSGQSPLVPVLEKIFGLPASRSGHEKKLLVFVATDGVSTDAKGNEETEALEKLLNEKRNVETTFVQFLVCTDEPEQINRLTYWDRTMTNVDVTRDIGRERDLVKQTHGTNRPFARGDYMIKTLLGAIDPEIDNWNESE